MFAQISDKIRCFLSSGNGDKPTNTRKRKIPSIEEGSGQSPAKRHRSESDQVSENISRGAIVDWITRTKTSFQDSYYFKRIVGTPNRLVEKFKGPTSNVNIGETNPQFGHYLPPLQQQQHTTFVQFQPPYSQPGPYISQGMENKDAVRHQVQSTPRSKYPQGYSFSKARHDVDNFQFAQSKENFAFKAPPQAIPSPANRYPPNKSMLPNRSSNDSRNMSHKTVYDRVFNRTGQIRNTVLEERRKKSRLAARESIRLDERSRYAELLQQFTTRIPGTAFGSGQIRQPASTLGAPLFGSTLLGSSVSSQSKLYQPSQLLSRQKSTGSRSSEQDSDSSVSITKVQVEPRRGLHEQSIIDLTEKSYIEIQSARKIRDQIAKTQSYSAKTNQANVEDVVSGETSRLSTPKQKSKLPQPYFESEDPEIIEVVTPLELPKSPADELLKKKLFECKYVEDDWVSNMQDKYSADKRKKQREILEESVKCQFHKEKRSEFEEKIEENLRRKLILAEKEPPVLEETFTEEEIDEKADFPVLSEEQEELIDGALVPHPAGQVLSDAFKINITRKDMLTLRGLNWLNDEIINFYMNLLMERGNQENFPSVHAFNTFFYQKIINSGHQGVKRWTRRIDLFSKDIIIVPVHLGMHWCLCIVDLRKKEIRYYDSMGGSNNQCLNALKQYLEDESLDKKKQPFDTSSFNLINLKLSSSATQAYIIIVCPFLDIPQQMNGSDCGVFACKFAEYISRDATINFTQEHMPYFRRRMVLEILTQKLL